MEHDKRYAVVTGAGSGLGRAICQRLARDGWHLALADIRPEKCQETLNQVTIAGGTGQITPLDVTRSDAWGRFREKLARQWPRLDLLVNNAGVIGIGETGSFPLCEWQRLLDVNLYGTIYGCHTMVNWLKANVRTTHIINTASFAAIACPPALAAYNVAKAGVVALSETLYTELKPQGVGVSVICPVFFPTDLLNQATFENPLQQRLASKLTQSASFTAADVANAAVSAMSAQRLYVILGGKARVYWRLKRLMPKRFLRWIAERYADEIEDANQHTAMLPRNGASF